MHLPAKPFDQGGETAHHADVVLRPQLEYIQQVAPDTRLIPPASVANRAVCQGVGRGESDGRLLGRSPGCQGIGRRGSRFGQQLPHLLQWFPANRPADIHRPDPTVIQHDAAESPAGNSAADESLVSLRHQMGSEQLNDLAGVVLGIRCRLLPFRSIGGDAMRFGLRVHVGSSATGIPLDNASGAQRSLFKR